MGSFSRNQLTSMAAVTGAGLVLGGAPAVASAEASGGASMAPAPLTQELQRGLNDLSHLQLPAGTGPDVEREGGMTVLTASEDAPTRYGSNHAGRYLIQIVTGARSSVNKISIAEGNINRAGQVSNGTVLEAQINSAGGSVAQTNYPFNLEGSKTIEASVLARLHETRLTAKKLASWLKLAKRLEAGMENSTPTGPYPLVWSQPKGNQVIPFYAKK